MIKKDSKKKKYQVQVEINKIDTKSHVPVYDGKQNNFDKLREKFETYYYTRGCGECLHKDRD